jgi:20S proteasome alpha/beta subunit
LTVIVGFVGDACAVMASDSEGTESGHTRFDVEKIWTSGGGLLLGYSGNSAVRDALRRSIDATVGANFAEAELIDRWDARNALIAAVRPVLGQFYSEFISTSQTADEALEGRLLVIGRDAAGHWLLEVDGNCIATFYEDRGLQAVGSGGPAAFVAHGLLRHYQPREQTVNELRLIAYRTIRTCIDGVGGPLGVGGDVHIWSCRQGEGYLRAHSEQLQGLEEGLAKWKTIERESLSVAIGTAPTDGEATQEGVPEALDDDGVEEDGSGDQLLASGPGGSAAST